MVKVSARTKAERRRAMLDAAARALMEHGPAGLSVAAATEAAGLTHGAFYRHFPSKSALAAEALRHAGARAAARAERHAARDWGAFVRAYLSQAHVADRAGGCPLPALAADAARAEGPELPAAFAEALSAFLAAAAGGPDAPPEARAAAAAELARLVGALVLARAAAPADPALAAEILAAARPAPTAPEAPPTPGDG